MAALSHSQRAALDALARRGECSAYGAGLRMRTLDALARRGLVTSRGGVGSMLSPTTNILWRITQAGRAAIWRVPGATAPRHSA